MTGPDRPSLSFAPTAEIERALGEHFDRSPIGLLLLDAEHKIVRANEALAQLTGIQTSVLAGSSLRRFLSTDAPFDLEDRLFEEVARAGSWLGQLEVITSIGDASPMLVSITPVGPGGESVRHVVAIVELGQQRWLEEESSRRAAELAAFASVAVATGSSTEPREMLNNAARAIVEQLEVDACWIHRFEPASAQVTLAGEASHLSSSLRLSPLLVPDSVNPALLRVIETGEHVAESELLDRSIATVVHAPLLALGEAVGVISILSVEGEKLNSRNSDLLRTVSYQIGTAIQNIRLLESNQEQQEELRQKHSQLELYVEELKHADRLKNEFLANTSHELRTPLNSIIGFLNLVLDGLCENREEEKELLGHALRSGRHLLDLINDVLDLARIEAGRLQLEVADVRLAPVLDEIGSTLSVQAAAKHIDFFIQSPPPELTVRADESRLRQVLTNVVANAIKFTPKGEVRITMEAEEGSPFVELTVKDTGIGIAPEKRDRLFRKFTQADASMTRKYGGTGLGLAISKDLLEIMGGSMRLESPGEGQGTVVTLTLVRSRSAYPEGALGGGAPGGGAPAPV